MATNSLYNERWISGNYQPHVVAYYFREWQEHHMQVHSHNQVEIMYVIKGKCTVDAMGSSFTMEKGDLILLDAVVPHRLLVEKGSPCRMLNIEFVFVPRDNCSPSIKELALSTDTLSKFLAAKRPYTLLKDPEEVYPALKSLIMELDQENSKHNLMVHLLLAQILIKISKMVEETSQWDSSPGSLHAKKALRYIHNHYDRNIRIEDISAALKIHQGYLHRVFKAYTGLTPVEYLTQLRINKAKMLLTRTDIPIIEVSNYVGINSRQYFSALFKKYTGKTPVQYRKSIDKYEGFDKKG